MTTDTPVKIMYLSPVGNRGADDGLFAKMAEDYRLAGYRGARHLAAR